MTPEEMEEIGRAIIINKLTDGDDLDRHDLQIILGLLCKDMQHLSYAKDIAAKAILPQRMQGYRMKGQGRREGSKIAPNKEKVALDYKELRETMTRKDTLKKLVGESKARYGRSLSESVISNYNEEGKKMLQERFAGLPDIFEKNYALYLKGKEVQKKDDIK